MTTPLSLALSRPDIAWRVKVPASIANLGPGFDFLAMAIDLHNEITVTPREDDSVYVDVGEGPPAKESGEDSLLVRAYRYAQWRPDVQHSHGANLRCHNRIPMGKGLGSSAAAIVGGLLAAEAVAEYENPRTGAADKAGDEGHLAGDIQRLVRWASEIEGHSDNVAAALLGGLVISGTKAPVYRIDVPKAWQCVLFIPESSSPTTESRRAVPPSFSREDAIFNAGRAALLVRAVALDEPETLRIAMQDRWHQPYRKTLFPAFEVTVQAATEAGAFGAALAGGGPSTAAVISEEAAPKVARAMLQAARDVGVRGEVLTVAFTNQRATIRPLRFP